MLSRILYLSIIILFQWNNWEGNTYNIFLSDEKYYQSSVLEKEMFSMFEALVE